MAQANLSLEFGAEHQYFIPEIIIDNDDAHRCSNAIYAPHLIAAQEQTLPAHLEAAAWAAYAQELNGREEGDLQNQIIYVGNTDNDGTPTVFETPNLKLIRYGCQIIRVYGPQRIIVWEKNILGHMVEQEIDLTAQEKLICLNHLNQQAESLESYYNINYQPINSHAQRLGHLGFQNFAEYKYGRFNQQTRPTDNGDLVVYNTTFTFGQKQIKKTFHILGNNSLYKGQQIQKIGRKQQIIREILNFAGDERKTIRYWYDNPIVTVLSWTNFVDETGQILDYRPNNAPLGSPRNYNPKRGKTFIAEKKCWGSILVEYKTTYTEFAVLYDFPEPRRQYEVFAGQIEKVGYQTFDQTGYQIEQGNYLNDNDLGYDQIVDDQDWIQQNPDSTDPPPKVAVKLFKKIQYKPFITPHIELFYTNGRQSTTTQFTPPQPDFMDIPLDELPKITIYEKRVREKLRGGAEVDHIEEITSLDVMGRVKKEIMEKR